MNFFINTRPRIAHFPSSWRWNSSTHRRQIPGLDGSDETKWRSVMTIWDLYGGCKYIDQYYISTVSVYNIYIYIHTYVHIYIHIHILCVICIYIYIYISADPCLRQGRGGAWDHRRRCGTCFCRLTTLKHLLGNRQQAPRRHPRARSMGSHGRSSLPFARP